MNLYTKGTRKHDLQAAINANLDREGDQQGGHGMFEQVEKAQVARTHKTIAQGREGAMQSLRDLISCPIRAAVSREQRRLGHLTPRPLLSHALGGWHEQDEHGFPTTREGWDQLASFLGILV